MALLNRISMILVLSAAAGCPGDDSATSSGADSAADSSTGAATTDGLTSTSAATSDGSGSGGATSGATSTTDATSGSATGTTTDATSTTGDETGTTGGVADCDGLDEAACTETPGCMGMPGQPIVPEMNGMGFCYGAQQFLFCIPAAPACLPATQTVCMGDGVYEAWSQCGALPTGWQACDPPGDVNGDC